MIHSFDYCKEKVGILGRVEQIKGSLVYASGLDGATPGQGVAFASGFHGEVLSIKEDLTEILVFSRFPLKKGEKAAGTGSQLQVSVGEGLLGHMIDALGRTLDNRREKSIEAEARAIEVRAEGISRRKRVSGFLETGVAVCDLLVPLGMGQRELVIGDRKSGKTYFLLQAAVSQAKKDRVVIFVLIGKRKTEIKQVVQHLEDAGVMKNCIVVAAASDDSPGEIYIAPFTAMAIAEYFRDEETDSLVIFDDLTTHAKYYREISLTAGRFPGRESYPGDIFYLHSKLLERAGNFIVGQSSASISCFPVAIAPAGDITGYIQTNIMSMTDGHIYFDSDLFFKGVRPAVNVFLSVTRVGKQTQTPLFREISREVLLLLKKNEDLQRFLRFGPEITPQVSEIINRGRQVLSFFNQMPDTLIPLNLAGVLIAMIWAGVWDGTEAGKIVRKYDTERGFKLETDTLISNSNTFAELISKIKESNQFGNCQNADN